MSMRVSGIKDHRVSGWIVRNSRVLRTGNAVFNWRRSKIASKISSGVATVTRFIGKPIFALSGLGADAYYSSDVVSNYFYNLGISSSLIFLGISSGLFLFGFGKLGRYIIDRMETVDGNEDKKIKGYLKEAEEARARGDYNALFLTALQLKKAGDELGERKCLEMYQRYRQEIGSLYNPPASPAKDFREYLVATKLDDFNAQMEAKLFQAADSVAQDIVTNFDHPLGKVARAKALKKLYKEHMKNKDYADAENAADELIKLGDPDGGRLKRGVPTP